MMLYRLRGDEALAETANWHACCPMSPPCSSALPFPCSRSRENYTVPTYMMLGLVTAICKLPAGRRRSFPCGSMRGFSSGLAFGSACFLAAMYVFVRVAVRWS